jgi:hypothetical protein
MKPWVEHAQVSGQWHTERKRPTGFTRTKPVDFEEELARAKKLNLVPRFAFRVPKHTALALAR